MKTKTKNKKKDDRKYNVLCILGFILSFFSWFLGFLLSIIGLFNIRKSNLKGRGLAIVGIVISVLYFINFESSYFFPHNDLNLAFKTACTLVDENGNYVYHDKGVNYVYRDEDEYSDEDGRLICENYECRVTYEGKKYKYNCNKE